MLRALPDWMFLLSSDGVYLDVHVRQPEQLLLPPTEFLGRNMREVLPPDLDREFRRCFQQVLKTDEIATLEYSLPVNGEARYYEARLVRCARDQILSVVRDLTERKRAEQQARDLADELAHVGRVTTLAALTGSLAHEIRQPLAAIMTNAQAAIRLMGATPPNLVEMRAALADIVSDNQRAADVVQRLRTLLRKEPPEQTDVDLNDSVAEVVKVLQSDISSKRIGLSLDLEPELPAVLGDRVQLQQVVLNLLVNAFDAVEHAGSASRRVVLKTFAQDSTTRLSVTDEGIGVADDQVPRMFEPFYTTKPAGMGLGLAICQTIIASHDGTITFERHADGGTTFAFSLPAASADGRGVRLSASAGGYGGPAEASRESG
jgi:PAS domain S-box-containing protein